MEILTNNISVSAISFDYGDVISVLDTAELARRLSTKFHASLKLINEHLSFAQYERDRITAAGAGHETAWRSLMRVLVSAAWRDHKFSAKEVDDTVDELWIAQPRKSLWRKVPEEARALLVSLKKARIPMVVTSNSEGQVFELLCEQKLEKLFITIIDSEVVGMSKPDPRIFGLAAAAMGVHLSDMVHVGDSEVVDIVGAKRAGAKALRFDAFTNYGANVPTLADGLAFSYPGLRYVLSSWLGYHLD